MLCAVVYLLEKPICDESYWISTEEDLSDSLFITQTHSRVIAVVVISIIALIAVSVTIFVFLQYRSHGRCVIRMGKSSSILVDGGGVVEYTSLAGKEPALFSAEDGLRSGTYNSTVDDKNYLSYDSD